MTSFRALALILAVGAAAGCSPDGSVPPAGNGSDPATAEGRRPSGPARLSQQELAIRIGPACPETTHVAYPAASDGGAEYLVTCGESRFRVVVAADGSTAVTPLRR